jgi:hypothetical protein
MLLNAIFKPNYMKKLIPFLLILLAGCKQPLPDIPSDVLPTEKMVKIIADMHIADAVAETKKAQEGKDNVALTNEYYKQIYKIHNVSEEDFKRSYKFYEDNPGWMDQVYKGVITELSKKQAEVGQPIK